MWYKRWHQTLYTPMWEWGACSKIVFTMSLNPQKQAAKIESANDIEKEWVSSWTATNVSNVTSWGGDWGKGPKGWE